MSSHSVNDLGYYHCGVIMAPVYGSVTNSNMILCNYVFTGLVGIQ